jgi:hypothetical protein
MPFGYVSPADAFSSTLEQAALNRQVMQERAIQTQLAIQREQRQAAHDAEEAQQAHEALAQKRQIFDQSLKDKDNSDFQSFVKGMMPGDIPDPSRIEQAKRLGYGHLFPADTNAVANAAPAPPEALAADPSAQPGPMPAPVPQAPLPQPFIGSREQRKDLEDKQAILDMTAGMPDGSPERKALEFYAKTGKVLPAGYAKEPGASEGTAVARVDPKRQVVQRLVNGQWVDATGDMPKGTHFLQEPPAKDTSAADARAGAHVDVVREHAYTELNARAKPIEDQISRINKLTNSLNQNSSVADSTLAEQLITLTAGGMGSGVRMSQPMIDQVLNKSRTRWEDLDVALRKWSTAPDKDKANTSLFFTDAQKQAMRDLARAYRQAANATHKKILDARSQIDSAKSVEDINRLRTKAEEDIFADDSAVNDAPAATVAPKKTFRYGLDGKPVQD